MNSPTTEQQAVIDSQARVRVVRAVPGSGKTWLVANLIKMELAQWQPNHGGIAALSFTRVGGEEIRRAVGYELHHPHFVGTIDSFLFRFVVRPFLKQVMPTFAVPRLIPADWEPNKWKKGANNTTFTVQVGSGNSVKEFNLFNVCFLGEKKGEPIVACKQWDWDPVVPLDGQARAAVLTAKRELWKKYGWLTHSDAAFLASNILVNQTYGPTVRNEVLRRFRLIIVDELQDTSWSLGHCVLQLLAEPSVRGVLVGDPDQAIYEFNGARPDLFERFTTLNGTQQLPLGHTLRCSSAVCRVAEHLTMPARRIEHSPDRTGRAFLLSYKSLEVDVGKLRDWLPSGVCNGVVKIVARRTKTVHAISGRGVKQAPKLRSVPLNHLHRAINSFRQGRQVASFAAVQATLEYAVFGREGITPEELSEKGIDLEAWKRLCVEVLLEANAEVVGESFEAWGKRMAENVQKRIAYVVPENASCGGTKKIRLPGGDAKTEIRQDYLAATASGLLKSIHIPVETVHAVKGETHDLTIFVCPEPDKYNPCPSIVWWSDEPEHQEERRIAFVAVTRTRGDLVVCVSEKCLSQLQKHRASFVQSFEQMAIDDFVARKSACVAAVA
jgi:DNA helicase-2/ATP-dependent DNA helicase PcrA